MSQRNTGSTSRRAFLKQAGALSAAAAVPYFVTSSAAAREPKSASDKITFGGIGMGGQGTGDCHSAKRFGPFAAFADVDKNHTARANQQIAGGKAELFEDYRKVLDRKDVDAVVIATPDHWHTKICVDALRAGKDVYCEKPLTLTIAEGQLLCKVVKETGRVLQVGTQQRSDPGLFLKAAALCQDGRLGKIKRIQCAIGGADRGGPFQKTQPPSNLNWDMWLGQAPMVDYIPQRCHGNFRWWYEYSGGKMTDWGAHHVDIAHWCGGKTATGPISIEGTATHPCEFKDGYPTVDDRYNAAYEFLVTCKFADGMELVIRHDTDNGVLIEAENGRFFVNRGKIVGAPIDALKEKPLAEDALVKAYKGAQPGDHMRNFVECVKSRKEPISDVWSHHRALTTCHLANIAIRLGRKLTWDPEKEMIVGDDQAKAMQARTPRKGYEIA